jgi:hypothetical protein
MIIFWFFQFSGFLYTAAGFSLLVSGYLLLVDGNWSLAPVPDSRLRL